MRKHRSLSMNASIALAALPLMYAASNARTRRVDVAPTPAQVAARTVRDERAEWNAAVEAKKAEKRARKNDA